MKQEVLQDESMEIHVALMSNSVEQQAHEEDIKSWRKSREKNNNTEIDTKT